MPLPESSFGLFAAVYVPHFILQAIGRSEPELRTQPLVIIDGPPPTYQVIAFNRLAELLGVTRGMSKAAAGQFAQVVIRPRCKILEEATHAALLDVGWSITPRVEDAAADTLLLDIAGLESLFGTTEAIAQEIAARASALGMNVHVAISANVETARIMARALLGPTIVPEGEERRYLETLPVGMLSPSAELADIFGRWGVATCKALASLPVLALSECVGQEGVRLHAIASGKGMRPLLLAEPAQDFAECLELDEAVDDLESLSFLLGRLLDQLSARLSARALSIAAVRVIFELQPAFDNAFDTSRDMLRVKPAPRNFLCTLEMPVPTRDAKLLLKLLRLRLQAHPPGAPIQKIQMTAQSSLARVTQGSLFVPTAPDPDKLELTIARIAAVVGEGNVGSPQLLDSHRPDAFHMQTFSVVTSIAAAAAPDLRSTATPTIALQAFRPAIPARVQLQNNQPALVFFQGRSGKVLHASGPWRSSGQWWDEKPWQEDAWDLEIVFTDQAGSYLKNTSREGTALAVPEDTETSGGLTPEVRNSDRKTIFATDSTRAAGFYRFTYDGLLEKWFVRGVYD